MLHGDQCYSNNQQPVFIHTKLIVYFFPNLFRLFHPHCAGFGPFGTSIAVLSQVIAASAGWVRAARQPVGSQTSIRWNGCLTCGAYAPRRRCQISTAEGFTGTKYSRSRSS
jgi:hypothetical protein